MIIHIDMSVSKNVWDPPSATAFISQTIDPLIRDRPAAGPTHSLPSQIH